MSESGGDEKKFANLHYPGMRAEPRDAEGALDAAATWRFHEQIECVGGDRQRALLAQSVFVTLASPLGVAVARKLVEAGVGRVGIFGDRPLSGSYGLVPEPDGNAQFVLGNFSRTMKTQFPWAKIETFRDASIDRQLGDMMRGFGLVVALGGPQATGEVLANARELKLGVIAAHHSGKQAWCAVFSEGFCEDCAEVPVLEQPGLYFPLLDHIAGWVVAVALDQIDLKPRASFVESIDATRSPWSRELRELVSRAGCPKCSAKS